MASPRIRDHQVKGNLVADPQRVVTPQGRNLTTFTLAENTRVRDAQGNWADGAPIYYDVAIDADNKANGHLAQNVEASLKKGQFVKVEGDLSTHAYIDKEGNPQVANRIWASDVSASMRFATVQVVPNQAPQQIVQAQAQQGVQPQQGVAGGPQPLQAPPLAQQPNHQQAAQDQMLHSQQDHGAQMQ